MVRKLKDQLNCRLTDTMNPLLLRPFFFFALLLCGSLSAQTPEYTPADQCVIEGLAQGRAGARVGAYLTKDYITGAQQLLAETTVNDSGSFRLVFELESTGMITLRCNKLKGYLYAEPGRTHRVGFPHRDSLKMVNPDMEYETELRIYSTDSTEVNLLVIDYNQRFDAFWKKNYQHFLYKASISKLDSFHAEMRKHYARVQNPFFLNWMDFVLASLEDATFHSEKKLAEQYLVYKDTAAGKKASYARKRPIYYENSEYMAFFNSFFDDYMYKNSIKREGEHISPAINVKGSYEDLLLAMKNLRFLENDTLRELVMLKGIFQSYNNPAFISRNLLSIAQQVSSRSKVPEHRVIARNIVAFYTKLSEGGTAPGFSAVDRKGKPVTLENFKGKYVLLNFYATWNSHSVAEQKILPELQKKYKKVVFVSVSLDQDTAAWQRFLKANPKMNWNMLHYNFNEKLKEDYQLLALPAFFIIDPEGRFWSVPADPPSGRLEYDLYKITRPKRP